MKHASYDIESVTPDAVRIRDMGPWNDHRTITNDVEWVVEQIYAAGYLRGKQRLLYWDSHDKLDEIEHLNGRFIGFHYMDSP